MGYKECTRVNQCWDIDGCNYCRTYRDIHADRPDNKANVQCSADDWLIKIADVPVNSVGYVLSNTLTKEQAQAAMDAQYGKGVFTATMHGARLYCWRRHRLSPYAREARHG